jgi:hypothetical protein
MYVIGINGFKRSGKGEVGNAIAEQVMIGGVKQVGFADKVKILGARALGFVDATDERCIELMDAAKERWLIHMLEEHPMGPGMPRFDLGTITGRQYLQNVGTEARKIFGDDFWVDQVLPPSGLRQPYTDQALRAFHPGVDWLAITDLRFPNEAQRVLDLGGEVWRVNRPGTESDGHASEIPLDDQYITRELDNSGDLDHLADEVAVALHYMEEEGIHA